MFVLFQFPVIEAPKRTFQDVALVENKSYHQINVRHAHQEVRCQTFPESISVSKVATEVLLNANIPFSVRK